MPGSVRRQNASDECLLESMTTAPPAASLIAAVEPQERPHVLAEVGAVTAQEPRRDQLRDEPRAVDAGPQLLHPRAPGPGPSHRRRRRPTSVQNGHREKRLPAAAGLVVQDAALPEVHQFADRAGAGQLAEHPLEHGRPAAPEAAQVEDPRTARNLLRRSFVGRLDGSRGQVPRGGAHHGVENAIERGVGDPR